MSSEPEKAEKAREPLGADKWWSLSISTLAFGVSLFAVYNQNIRENHDVRALLFHNQVTDRTYAASVLLTNAGNRTEAVTKVRLLFSNGEPGRARLVANEVGPFLLKPGDAQIVKLEGLMEPEEFPNGRKVEVSIDYLIVDARSGKRKSPFLEADEPGVVIQLDADGQSRSSSPVDLERTGFVSLYDGESVE